MKFKTCPFCGEYPDDLVVGTNGKTVLRHDCAALECLIEVSGKNTLELSNKWHTRGGRLSCRTKGVVCLETEEYFASVSDAGALAGSANAVRRAILKGCRAGGYHWAYADDPELEAKLDQWKDRECEPFKRGVVCLETGECFGSTEDARRSRGANNIRKSIRKGQRSGGYHWAYTNDPDLEAKLAQWKDQEPHIRRKNKIFLELGIEVDA